MDQETEKFIIEADETYIGDQHRVSGRQKSGGGKINVFQERGKAPGALPPFS